MTSPGKSWQMHWKWKQNHRTVRTAALGSVQCSHLAGGLYGRTGGTPGVSISVSGALIPLAWQSVVMAAVLGRRIRRPGSIPSVLSLTINSYVTLARSLGHWFPLFQYDNCACTNVWKKVFVLPMWTFPSRSYWIFHLLVFSFEVQSHSFEYFLNV